MNKKTVGIGMSGGVDSAAAAYLLKEQGYDVVGITMKLIDDDKSNISINDAKEVCSILGINHYVIDLQKEFKDIVITNFIDSFKNGITPNPCVVCNKHFKFGLFYDKARELGCDLIATGHYAKIENGRLYRADVIEKDQSYFLYGINRELLNHIIFPLQGYKNKEEIRTIAKKAGLTISHKKDSQEICFIPNDDYKSFLNNNLTKEIIIGDICLKDGTVLGKHSGLINYTIGQRKGLNISYKEPLYVTMIDKENNRVIVGSNEDLFSDTLLATNINLLVDKKELNKDIYAKVRSRGQLRKCKVEFLSNNDIKVTLLEKERAITKGQSVVFYDNDNCCLGGGVIN
ncbi:MAG: tRNA 2-thiouridine(34) synthase MnmA [Bacilli bacterium]|nr:tRNA 2-thiouridine(34) synthase MnmA [Bacilli bacterium]